MSNPEIAKYYLALRPVEHDKLTNIVPANIIESLNEYYNGDYAWEITDETYLRDHSYVSTTVMVYTPGRIYTGRHVDKSQYYENNHLKAIINACSPIIDDGGNKKTVPSKKEQEPSTTETPGHSDVLSERKAQFNEMQQKSQTNENDNTLNNHSSSERPDKKNDKPVGLTIDDPEVQEVQEVLNQYEFIDVDNTYEKEPDFTVNRKFDPVSIEVHTEIVPNPHKYRIKTSVDNSVPSVDNNNTDGANLSTSNENKSAQDLDSSVVDNAIGPNGSIRLDTEKPLSYKQYLKAIGIDDDEPDPWETIPAEQPTQEQKPSIPEQYLGKPKEYYEPNAKMGGYSQYQYDRMMDFRKAWGIRTEPMVIEFLKKWKPGLQEYTFKSVVHPDNINDFLDWTDQLKK